MMKTCEVCGKEYETNRPNQLACCKACAKLLNKKKKKKLEVNFLRPVTGSTLILVESYWRKDGYSAAQIAWELRRDVSVIEKIIVWLEKERIEKGR